MPVTRDYTPAAFSFIRTIPPSVRKALTDYWGSEDILVHPEILADLGPDALIRINRIGRKSLQQIAQALGSSGYIDSPETWLTREK